MGVYGDEGDFEIGLECVLEGCTDATACNFDASANLDDGSCTYPESEYLDCEGTLPGTTWTPMECVTRRKFWDAR